MFEIFRTSKTTDFSELLSLELCHFSNEIFAAFELNCVISLYGSLKESLQNHFGYRMAAVMCQVLPDFYKKFCEKSLFICVSVKDYKPYLLTSEYSVASHNCTFCPLKNCSYHIILISSSINELLQKLEDLSFQYQTVDCLYTLYKHQFFGHTNEEAGLVFTQLKRAVQHNSENKFVEKLPSVSKKRLSRKKFKRHLLRAEQRNASTQTLRSSFFDRIQSLKNSKYESELIKIVDCLLDGHGIIDNPMLYFEVRK